MELRVIGSTLLCLTMGCSAGGTASSVSVVPGSGVFGDGCERSEDCTSTFCVGLGDSHGVCSTACVDTSDCPIIDNWDCVVSTSTPIKVCACRKLAEREICGDDLDNDCNGVADDCRRCDGIEVPDNDLTNCGSCGNRCRADQACLRGSCSCPANEPNDCGSCTDVSTDPANCGSCGTHCGPGQSCVNGNCTCPAGSAVTYCSDVGCVDTEANQDHCGSCGNACTLGRICTGGICGCPVDEQQFCPGVGCIDLNTDQNHCGSCDVACASGKICTGGHCGCSEGRTSCNEVCTDLLSAIDHCGSCGASCGKTQACVGGKCGCGEFGLTICTDACADLNTSVSHCGSCGHACATGERCNQGACSCDSGLYCDGVCVAANDAKNCGACGKQCSSGAICTNQVCACSGTNLSVCNGTCADLRTDKANCGACGTSCAQGQSCIAGVCGCTSSLQTYCPTVGGCAYLQTDNKNCGACGNACGTGQTCSAGTCRCTTASQTYCPDLGTCSNLQADARNCGACGTVCRTGESCTSGQCKCPTDQVYCTSASKCVTLSNDAANCGSCDRACMASEICQFGTCHCPSSAQLYCPDANACIDVSYDEQNCGACGKLCPAMTSCLGGTCSCDESGLTLCDDACVDLKSDKQHCSSCTNSCSGSTVCASGKCLCPVPSVGTPVRVTNNALDDSRPVVVWDGTHVGMAYFRSIGSRRASDLRFALLNPDATVLSDVALTDYASDPSTGAGLRPALVWNGSEYALLWVEYSSKVQLKFLRVDAAGNAKGAPVTVGPDTIPNSLQVVDAVSLAWSPSYGGYATAYGGSYWLAFRRLGATGTVIDPVNHYDDATAAFVGISGTRPPRLGVNPDGSWVVTVGTNDGVSLFTFNADGSRTAKPISLGSGFDSVSAVWPAMVNDGNSWWTTWMGQSANTFVFNRGVVSNGPFALALGPTGSAIGEVRLAMVGSGLTVGWTERSANTTTAFVYRMRLQRYGLPTDTSSKLVALHEPADVLSTYTIADKDDTGIVGTGNDALLAVWADARWGAARELYAVPIQFPTCP